MLLLGSDKSRILVDMYFSNFTSTQMTLYQSHHTVIKLKSVYEKSLQHLAYQVVLLNKFWARWKEVEFGLADFIIRKILLALHRLYLLEKKSNSNWSFRRSKWVVRNRQLHTYGKSKEDSSQWYRMAQW